MELKQRISVKNVINYFLAIVDNYDTKEAVERFRKSEKMYAERKDIEQLKVLDFQARLLGIKNTDAIKWNITKDRVENFLRLSGYKNSKEYKDSTKQMNIPPYLKEFLDEFYRDSSNTQIGHKELMKIRRFEIDPKDDRDDSLLIKNLQVYSDSVKKKLLQRKESEGSASTAYCNFVIENIAQVCNMDTIKEHAKYMNKFRDVKSSMIVYHADCGMSNAEIIKQNEFMRLNQSDRSFWLYASAQNPTNETGYLNQNAQGLYGLTANGTITVGGSLKGRTDVKIPTISVYDLIKPTDDLWYLVKFQKVFYAIVKAVGDDHTQIFDLVKMIGGDDDKLNSAKTRFTGIILSLYYFNQDLLEDFGYDVFIAYLKSQAILHHDVDKKNAIKIIRTSCKMCNIDIKENKLDSLLNSIERQNGQLIQFQDLGIIQMYLALYKQNRGLQFDNIDLNVVPKEMEKRIQLAYTLSMYRNLGLDSKKTCFGVINIQSLFSDDQVKLMRKFSQSLSKANDTSFTCIIPIKIIGDRVIIYYDPDIYNLIYFLLYSRQEDTEAWRCLVS